jgi:hypothetical protein
MLFCPGEGKPNYYPPKQKASPDARETVTTTPQALRKSARMPIPAVYAAFIAGPLERIP